MFLKLSSVSFSFLIFLYFILMSWNKEGNKNEKMEEEKEEKKNTQGLSEVKCDYGFCV